VTVLQLEGWLVACSSESSRFLRPSARRWKKHLSLWRVASATPDQPPSVTAHWPVANYTARWQRHVRLNNLPRLHRKARRPRPGVEPATCWSPV